MASVAMADAFSMPHRDSTAFCASLAGCILGSSLSCLRTVGYSPVRRTDSLRLCPHGFMNKKAFSWFGTGLDRLLCFACRLHPRQLSQLPADQSLFASSPGWLTDGSALTGSSPSQKHKNEKEMGKTHLFSFGAP